MLEKIKEKEKLEREILELKRKLAELEEKYYEKYLKDQGD